MQATYCNVCRRELLPITDDAYWYVKPANMGRDYRPPSDEYQHVSLCSDVCLKRWALERAGDPADALGAPLDA